MGWWNKLVRDKKKGLTLPYEAVDSITLANLIEMRDDIERDMKNHIEKGTYMHPNDYHMNATKYLPALNTLIEYMGGR